ncbi:alpha/beta hydrolase family protein [Actinomadura opuntiae]|uniref:alpha/beta hydrolase family protein n=1 Tax=Actinomadura sp. OS1-43 TaxID=604315 RepID=UPI00255A8894|nr:alpha/beta hydrolase [Actinomadura sp. OS1-43]MDL4815429.1 alpha/beta hydrolase [Actinomadura sp. OS1-43]
MNDPAELKEFAALHARNQDISGYERLLGRIGSDDPDRPDAWVRVWSEAAAEHEAAGRLLDACRHYNMARFPYVDGPARQAALERCVDAFDRWRGDRGIERIDLEVDGARVGAWAAGLSADDPKPLVVVMGGIVSIKEQWAPAMAGLRRLGMAAVVTELPGVGENTLRYTPDGHRMLSAVVDAVAGRADTARTYALAFSFGGHLALRCAADDPRIRGVVTAGAPVHDFFTDTEWHGRVPQVTVDTLAHLTGTKPEDVLGSLGDWALPAERLAALSVPVHYMASARDEIIPPGETAFLRRHVRDLDLLRHDDVHGSPGHVAETRLWTAWSLLRMRGELPVQRAVLGALLRARRALGR